jgi:hypothetical protein
VEPVFQSTVTESLLTNLYLSHLRLFLLIIFILNIPNFIINILDIYFLYSILIPIFLTKIEGREADEMSVLLPLLAHIPGTACCRLVVLQPKGT